MDEVVALVVGLVAVGALAVAVARLVLREIAVSSFDRQLRREQKARERRL